MKDLAVMNEERSVVTVGQNGLSFNVKTADVLHQAAFVRVLLNTKTKRLRKRLKQILVPYIGSTRRIQESFFKIHRNSHIPFR